MALTEERQKNAFTKVCIKKEEKEESLTTQIDIEDVDFNAGDVTLEGEPNNGDASHTQQGQTVASRPSPPPEDESKTFGLQDIRGIVVGAPNAVFDAEKLSSSVERLIKTELETDEQETKMFLFVDCSAEDPLAEDDTGENNYNALAEAIAVEEDNESDREKKSIRCFNCSASFRFLNDLDTHMTIYHNPGKSYYCRFCPAVLPTVGALTRHESSHPQNNLRKCRHCCKLFHKDQLDAHMFVHIGEKRFACQFCPNKYLNEWHLKNHLKSHVVTNDPPTTIRPDSMASSCQPASIRDGNKSTINNALIRRSEKLYFCCHCQMELHGTSAVSQHEGLMHPGRKLKPCLYCSATFPSTSELKDHMVFSHAKERPFACPLCPNRYPSKGELNRHSRSHSEERPYSCSYCSRSFRQPGSLKDHLMTHTSEKQFCCAHCPSRFYRKKNLELHVRIHSHKEFSKKELEQEYSVKPYFCTICFARFTCQPSRNRHMKKGSCNKPQSIRNVRPMPSSDIRS